MAASALSAPGTQYGPCANPFEHRDCAASREMAEAPCYYGDGVIGYERRFYMIQDGSSVYGPVYAHAVCHEEHVEAEQVAAGRAA